VNSIKYVHILFIYIYSYIDYLLKFNVIDISMLTNELYIIEFIFFFFFLIIKKKKKKKKIKLMYYFNSNKTNFIIFLFELK